MLKSNIMSKNNHNLVQNPTSSQNKKAANLKLAAFFISTPKPNQSIILFISTNYKSHQPS